jgi:EAL domain-containing protein (putative c-di-GMP-specific phosphodiesterase class I)
VLGYEALLRPNEGSPLAVIDTARREGWVSELDRWVIKQACLEAADWLAPYEVLFVNAEPETVAELSVQDLLRLALPSEQVVIEMTERAPMEALNVRPLRTSGVRLALDDFGCGHSNLVALESLRPDFLKLDHRFWARHRDEAVAMLAETERMGCSLIVEGIETEEDLASVRRLSIPYAQGFYLGRPAVKFQEQANRHVWVPP